MYQQQICPSNDINITYVQLLDVHLWGKNANIYATYELAPTSDVAKIAVHRWQITLHDDDTNNNTDVRIQIHNLKVSLPWGWLVNLVRHLPTPPLTDPSPSSGVWLTNLLKHLPTQAPRGSFSHPSGMPDQLNDTYPLHPWKWLTNQ